ncbi:MAG: response regulator transcription factor [Gammaproteobacteria bacterium]|nr:response regulator transcription factor [Gammaproteobacteria bacterium]MCP5200308.1 response regulator transcription factor [Gammaproteobacteria bacterium]
MHLLLVEDNDHLAASIGEYFESCGDQVDYAHDGAVGLNLARALDVDALVVDVSLPRLNGLQVTRALRDRDGDNVPILLLTARDSLDDKLAGFAAGADDYLTKPFELLELRARLLALVRRKLRPGTCLRAGPLVLDTVAQQAWRGELRIDITHTKWRLLETLMRRAPGVVTHAELAEALWGSCEFERAGALRVHIHALRCAVDAGFDDKLIRTVSGVGYRIRIDAD